WDGAAPTIFPISECSNPDADTLCEVLSSNSLVLAQRADVYTNASGTHVLSQRCDLRYPRLWCWIELKQCPREFFAFLDGRGWIRRKVIHFFGRRAKHSNDPLKRFDRDIALASFEPFDRALADVDRLGERFLREPASLPEFAKIDCDGLC